MMDKDKSKPGLEDGLLNFLRKLKEDRGARANLRAALVESRQRQSWPILAPFDGIGSSHLAKVVRTVAGLYAAHPKETDRGDFGSTCLALVGDEERRKLSETGEPGPVSKRFMHLLAAEGDEIFERTVRFALRAKTHRDGVPIRYAQLFKDLRTWEHHADWVRERWARSFWASRAEEADK